MSKFGWSYPPGVTTLPGESAADLKAEEMAERINTALEPLTTLTRELIQQAKADDSVLDRAEDAICLVLMDMIEAAYNDGYQDGISDEQLAAEERS